MWLTDQFIEYPCIFIGLGLFILFIITLIAMTNNYFELNDTTNRDFLIWDDEKTFAWDKLTVAEEFILANEGEDNNEKPLQMTPKDSWNPVVLFRTKDGGSLLEKNRLLKIKQIEKKLTEFEGWS